MLKVIKLLSTYCTRADAVDLFIMAAIWAPMGSAIERFLCSTEPHTHMSPDSLTVPIPFM